MWIVDVVGFLDCCQSGREGDCRVAPGKLIEPDKRLEWVPLISVDETEIPGILVHELPLPPGVPIVLS